MAGQHWGVILKWLRIVWNSLYTICSTYTTCIYYISELSVCALDWTRLLIISKCFFSGTVSTNLHGLRDARVYIVHCCVVTSDGSHLLAESRSHRLFTSGKPGTIPCRPTRPDVTVTLMKSSRLVALDDNLAFDPRAGFTVQRANKYFDGFFTCRASLDGRASQQNVIVKYKGKSSSRKRSPSS